MVLGFVAYQNGNRLLLLVAGLLVALTVIAALLARFRSMRLSVRRAFAPTPVSAGAATSVTIDAANIASIQSAPLYWNDILPWRPLATEPVRLAPLAPVSGRGRRVIKLRYELVPPRRGVFAIGPLAVAYSDPFGLAVGFMTLGAKDELVVTPHVTDLPLSGVWFEAPDGTARLLQTTGIGNSDDLMTREYRRGDALRRVHWRASARHGELMVRQEEQRAYPEATIIVDTRDDGYRDFLGAGRARDTSAPQSDAFEWAVSMLASLGVHLHRSGFVVHVAESAKAQVTELADEESRLGREQDFLLSLAAVQLVKESGAPERPQAEGPVFALVAEPSTETLKWLIGMRKPFELGVVFVIGASRTVAGELDLAGWRVIPVDTYTDLTTAWLVLAEELGTSSALR